jgi:hypothetical protein
METHDIDNAQTMVYNGIDSMVLSYWTVEVGPKRRGVVFVGNATRQLEVMP